MRIRSALLFSFALVALSIPVRFSHALAPGEAAPDFSATDSNGKTQTLSKMKGKFVVLEWFNQGCPYVKKHYDSGNMQKLQKQYTGKDVVWWTILSSAPGKQGYETAAEAKSVDENAADEAEVKTEEKDTVDAEAKVETADAEAEEEAKVEEPEKTNEMAEESIDITLGSDGNLKSFDEALEGTKAGDKKAGTLYAHSGYTDYG